MPPRSSPRGVAVLLLSLAGGLLGACTTIDPGPTLVVPNESFNEDYFFCQVEPVYLFGKGCGSGDPAAGDATNGCHFNAAAVSGMPLLQHDPIDCGGGDRPVNRAGLGAGSPARANLQAATLEMSRDYLTAPIYVRPLGANHPRAVITADDPAVAVLREWAERP